MSPETEAGYLRADAPPALEPSLQLLWRNLPSLTEVDLFGPGGAPMHETVLTPLGKSDLLFRLALVVRL